MKIKEKGSIGLAKQRTMKVFHCKTCGCKFEADYSEYIIEYNYDTGKRKYTCKCPECSVLVYGKKKKKKDKQNSEYEWQQNLKSRDKKKKKKDKDKGKSKKK